MQAAPSSNSIHPKSRFEWYLCFEKNHTRIDGIWIGSYKKAPDKV
jgi:hypothetical protein